MNKPTTIAAVIALWALYLGALVVVAHHQLISYANGITQSVLALWGILISFCMLRSWIFQLSTPYVPIKGMFGERYAIVVDVAISVMGILTYGLIRRAVCITEGAFHKGQLKEYQAVQIRRTRQFIFELSAAVLAIAALATYLARI